MTQDYDVYKPVAGYETRYEVNAYGDVRRTVPYKKPRKGLGSGIGAEMRHYYISGHPFVSLDGKMILVARVVASTWIDRKARYCEIINLEGDKTDTYYKNLRILQPYEAKKRRLDNLKHANKVGSNHKGARKRKLSPETIQSICAEVSQGQKFSALARKYKVHRSTIALYVTQNAAK